MESTTIKVSPATRDRVKAIGAQRHQSADKVIQAALDELDRKLFWDDYDEAVSSDQDADDTSAEWATALADGIDG